MFRQGFQSLVEDNRVFSAQQARPIELPTPEQV